MKKISVLAIDLGGESGRVIKMDFDGVKFYLEEIHRFPNLPVEASSATYWDVLSLWHEIQSGIAKSNSVNSLGVDSWGWILPCSTVMESCLVIGFTTVINAQKG